MCLCGMKQVFWDITSCSPNCFAAAAVLEGKWHKEDEAAFLFERNETQKCAVYLRSCCQACEISLGLYSSATRKENKNKAFQFRLKPAEKETNRSKLWHSENHSGKNFVLSSCISCHPAEVALCF